MIVTATLTTIVASAASYGIGSQVKEVVDANKYEKSKNKYWKKMNKRLGKSISGPKVVPLPSTGTTFMFGVMEDLGTGYAMNDEESRCLTRYLYHLSDKHEFKYDDFEVELRDLCIIRYMVECQFDRLVDMVCKWDDTGIKCPDIVYETLGNMMVQRDKKARKEAKKG